MSQVYKFAVIGYPLSHSLSKVIHETALKSCNLEGSYDILPTEPENLVHRIKRLKVEGYNGFNVTIPHKVPITLFLSKFDTNADLIGSVNTVKITEDKNLEGSNTDIYGFVKPIPDDVKENIRDRNAVVLGTGGAARAICAGLVSLGVSTITFYSRNVIDSHAHVEILRQKFPKVKIELKPYTLLDTLKGQKILVNTTPVGMKNFLEGVSPVDFQAIKTLDDDAFVYDIVYNPVKTRLIKYAQDCNIRHVGGLDMLVYQAQKAFEIWTGQVPDVAAMKIAALESLV
mgnify:CR=1 FL=1